MPVDAQYTKITWSEAVHRNLHHGGVEERTDVDGVRRAYHEASQTYWDTELDPADATAQDVIDALRMALMAQKEPAKALAIVNVLIEYAPETHSSRGIDLLLHLITSAALKVEVADAS